jgi:competence protein ComEC
MGVVHQKNPLIVIFVIYAAGILAGKFVIPYPLSLWLLILSNLLLIIIFRCPFFKKYSTPWILGELLLAGALRFHLAAWLLPVHHLVHQDLSWVDWVQGTVLETHYSREKGDRYLLSADSLHEIGGNKPACGKILFHVPAGMNKFHYGQRLRIFGQPETPPTQRNPGQFNYRDYLAARDIYHFYSYGQIDSIMYRGQGDRNWFLYRVINPLHDYCGCQLNRYLQTPAAGLLNALLLGEKQDLSQETIGRFKELGVIHVLAISGLHVGYIILFVFTLFSLLRFSKKYKILGLGLVLIIYVNLVRFVSPVLRAALMAILFLLGEISERKVSAYNILAGVALLILVWEPRELFQVGFQFSFLGVLALIYGPAKVERLLPMRKWLRDVFPDNRGIEYFLKGVWVPLQVSMAVVMINIPLTMYYYGAIPTYAVIANLVVIPLVGIIVFLGIFLLIASGFSNWLAAGIGEIINWLDSVLSWVVQIISGFPGSYIDVPYPKFWQVVLWTVVIFLVLNFKDTRIRKPLLAILSLYAIYLICTADRTGRQIQAAFLDVGQGDASCLVFPNHNTMLIDAGDRQAAWDSGQNTLLPFLKHAGILHVQYAVISHPHDDHIAGFYSLLQKITLDTLVISHYQYPSAIYSDIISLCRRSNIFIRQVQKGDCLYPDRSCRVYVLHPDSQYTVLRKIDGATCNNNSIVLKIQYGQNGILFTGDLQREAENSILLYKEFLECEILKVAHHGAVNATSVNLLNYVQPLCAVISVGRKNKFNHPSTQTLNRFSEKNIPCYQTSQQGALIFEIGREQIRRVNWR